MKFVFDTTVFQACRRQQMLVSHTLSSMHAHTHACTHAHTQTQNGRKNIILTGMWFVSDKSTTHGHFLKPFVDECLDLERMCLLGQLRMVKYQSTELTRCSCDLPARALLQCVKQYNNRHGCSCCTHEGKVVKQGIQLHLSIRVNSSTTGNCSADCSWCGYSYTNCPGRK